MNNSEIPLEIEGINATLYAGFWRRLGSILLDVIIMIPWIYILHSIQSISIIAYYLTIPLALAFVFFYNIFLVKRFGGTPGKLALSIKILKLNGDDVTWREAVLRESVNLLIALFTQAIIIYSLSQANDAHYRSLTSVERAEYLLALAPALFTINTWLSNVWVYSELVVLLTNNRRRSIHDFIAGTVVVNDKYVHKIREYMSARKNEQVNAYTQF
jgi:uncharacterized RDD family membrane protein YckC